MIRPVRSATSMNSSGAEKAALRVVPAHQTLGRDRAAAPELDLRLVVEHELVLGQRAAQVGGQHQPLGLW